MTADTPTHPAVVRPGGHVFISYARVDGDSVDRLQRRLEAEGVPVWRDTRDLWPGQDWRVAIRQAIMQDALVFIACFSTRSVSREDSFQNEELLLAIEQLRKRRPGIEWLLPVRLDNCNIPEVLIDSNRTLRSIHWADAFGGHSDDTRLVKAVLRILHRHGDYSMPTSHSSSLPASANTVQLDLGALARQLAAMSENDAAMMLETTLAEQAVQILGALPLDAARLVSLISRLSQSKASEMMTAAPSAPDFVVESFKAARELSSCASSNEAALGDKIDAIALASISMQGTSGFYQSFEHGQLHWSERGGARATLGPIDDYFRNLGSSGGRLGFPLTQQTAIQRREGSRTTGYFQRFEYGSNYNFELCERLDLICGATVYASAYGVHGTWGGIGEFYETNGGTGGWLGLPTTDEVPLICDSVVVRQVIGVRQEFEGGAVYFSQDTGAIAVSTKIAIYIGRRQRPEKLLYFPVSESLMVNSASGTAGDIQKIRRYAKEMTASFDEAIIYRCDKYGARVVSGSIMERHNFEGGVHGWLGFPISESAPIERSSNSLQKFEGGLVYRHHSYGAIGVRSTIAKVAYKDVSTLFRIGYPTLPESTISGTGIRIQFFERGLVTERGTTVEAWFRTEKIPAPVGLSRAPTISASAHPLRSGPASAKAGPSVAAISRNRRGTRNQIRSLRSEFIMLAQLVDFDLRPTAPYFLIVILIYVFYFFHWWPIWPSGR